jgi:hypothetical protein
MVIQGLIFLNIVSATEEQFSCARNDCLFRVGNTSGNFLLISFKPCCFVKLVPWIDPG